MVDRRWSSVDEASRLKLDSKEGGSWMDLGAGTEQKKAGGNGSQMFMILTQHVTL